MKKLKTIAPGTFPRFDGMDFEDIDESFVQAICLDIEVDKASWNACKIWAEELDEHLKDRFDEEYDFELMEVKNDAG